MVVSGLYQGMRQLTLYHERYRYQLEAFVDRLKGREPHAWVTAESSITQMEWVEKTYHKVRCACSLACSGGSLTYVGLVWPPCSSSLDVQVHGFGSLTLVSNTMRHRPSPAYDTLSVSTLCRAMLARERVMIRMMIRSFG